MRASRWPPSKIQIQTWYRSNRMWFCLGPSRKKIGVESRAADASASSEVVRASRRIGIHCAYCARTKQAVRWHTGRRGADLFIKHARSK